MSTEFTPSGQLQFGLFFQGVNAGTVWKSEEAGSTIDFESFRHLLTTAERGKFATFFLGEGLRLRENQGRIFEFDVAGRPDAQTLLAAAAKVTSNIGLVATQNTTYTDPAELAWRLQSLNWLSQGRAAWNVVTTDNAWTGANFRRGGYLDHADRYKHAGRAIEIARGIWDGENVSHTGDHYTVEATSPIGRTDHPVLFQAGASSSGRELAAKYIDAIFSPFTALDAALDFRKDLVERTKAIGRDPNSLKILPAAEFILAETRAEVEEKEAWVREHQVGPQQAIAYLENFWGTDLSAYDPDGPLPDIDPVIEETDGTRGTAFTGHKTKDLIDSWREETAAKGQSIRDFATVKLTRPDSAFVGTYDEIADRLVEYARVGAVDGFNITPWIVPHGIDDVVDHLIPRLQDRGIYPAEYAGNTLRENLGL